MTMQIIEFSSAADCNDLELRERASVSVRGRHTKHYIVKEGSIEVAFVAIDFNLNVDYAVLYELYVVRTRRRTGIASRLLHEFEQLVRESGYGALTAWPKPLDKDYSETALRSWYVKRGFGPGDEHIEELQKLLR
jgi:GNAT superfamily N-acetyltransferase